MKMKLSVSALALFILSLLSITSALADDETTFSLDKQTAIVLSRATQSKNATVQSHAFSMLSKEKGISDLLDSKVVISCIEAALQSESSNVTKYGFQILDNSNLSKDDKHRLLFLATESPKASLLALRRLTAEREELLPEIIEDLKNNLNETSSKTRTNRIRVLEHWGPDAKEAVPVLIATYDALRDAEIKNHRERHTNREFQRRPRNRNASEPLPKELPPRKFDESKLRLKFEYLDIVYALAAIGPDAKDALPIATAAIQEASNKSRKNKEAYELAGMLCMERMLGVGESNGRSRIGGLMGNVQGGAMLGGGGGLGGTIAASSVRSSKSVRRTVGNHLIRLAGQRRTDNTQRIEEQVALVFQNHDLLTEKGKLTIEEVRNIEPAILFTKVDTNSDQTISKDELHQYFTEKAKSRSRTSRSR